MSPISALRRLWRALLTRPESNGPATATGPGYADFATLWPDLTVTECASAAEAWEALDARSREQAYFAAVQRAIHRKGRERYGAMKRFLAEREFNVATAVVVRRAAGTIAELACIALFVAMVWTWAAIGAGA